MKRRCKDIDITSVSYIEDCIRKFIVKKKKDKICRFFAKMCSKKRSNVMLALKTKNSEYYKMIREVTLILSDEIKNRKLELRQVNYYNRICPSTHKPRRIGVQCPKQQLYDYIVVNALKPIINICGRYQCACLDGRGQEYGVRAIKRWLKDPEMRYAAKMDIRKCYESVDKELLLKFLTRKIKNDDLLWLIETLINSFDYTLSIGSYISQYLCNIFLSQAYHYLSSIKCPGVSHVLFYMDDILVIGKDKDKLRSDVLRFITFMKDEMKLEIKKNWTLFRLKEDNFDKNGQLVEMMGYRIYRNRVTLRKKTYKHIRRILWRIRRLRNQRKWVNKNLLLKVPAYKGRVLGSDLFAPLFLRVASFAESLISSLNILQRCSR